MAKPTEAKVPEKPTETKTETPKETKLKPPPQLQILVIQTRVRLLGGIGVSETGNITGFGGTELTYFTPLFTSGGNNHPADRWVCIPTVFPNNGCAWSRRYGLGGPC